MHVLEAIILGIVQGLTEFLPISSSAHLRVVGLMLPGGGDPGATFTAVTQLGTELAVIIFFWRTIVRIISRWAQSLTGKVARNDPDARMGWLVIIGTIPIGVIGFLAQEQIRGPFRNLWLVAGVLIVFGLILGLADYLGRKNRELQDLTYPSGLAFGLAQVLALIPGVSRSGATTTMGLALGFSRTAAAEYSFLLAIPAVFGSGLYELYKSFDETGQTYSMGDTAIATVVAFVVGILVIKYLMQYLKKGSFLPFVIYRVVLGVVLMILLGLGVIPAIST